MSTERVRGPAAKGAERREEIIAAVLQVVADRGFSSWTLRDIAERVGVGEANILHHFGSKQELLLAVIRRHDDEDMADLQSSPDARVAAAIVSRHEQTPGLVELLIGMTVSASSATGPTNEFFRDRYDRLRSVGDRHWGPDAEVTPEGTVLPPEWISRIVLAAADGLQLQWLLDPTVDMAADVEKLITVFAELTGRQALHP
jgi:AcrR family transcriptional regulator